jgi:hypothetical protein
MTNTADEGDLGPSHFEVIIPNPGCPNCPEVVEGDFKTTDEITCPACHQAFKPELSLGTRVVIQALDEIGQEMIRDMKRKGSGRR